MNSARLCVLLWPGQLSHKRYISPRNLWHDHDMMTIVGQQIGAADGNASEREKKKLQSEKNWSFVFVCAREITPILIQIYRHRFVELSDDDRQPKICVTFASLLTEEGRLGEVG